MLEIEIKTVNIAYSSLYIIHLLSVSHKIKIRLTNNGNKEYYYI